MSSECQETCCVEKRIVTIPLGFNIDVSVIKGIKFATYIKAPDSNTECARKFNLWMRKNVTGEFYSELLKEMRKSEE